MKRINLIYYMLDEKGRKKDPELEMEKLGIKYKYCERRLIYDVWQFIDCEVPKGTILPKYIEQEKEINENSNKKMKKITIKLNKDWFMPIKITKTWGEKK
jgi:hypothetical protein